MHMYPMQSGVFRHLHLHTDILCVCRALCLDQTHQLPDTGYETGTLPEIAMSVLPVLHLPGRTIFELAGV